MRRFRHMPIPQRAHPLVRRLYAEMNHQQIGVTDMAERTGIARNAINDWKDRSNPQVQNLDACFAALGLQLTVKVVKDE